MKGPALNAVCLPSASRRVTDELHDTRPRWLRSLSRGIDLILLAIIAPIGESFLAAIILRFRPPSWNSYPDFIGFDLSAVLLAIGVILLTRPEGYAPADRADRRLRILMRIVVIVPIAAMVLLHLQLYLLISSGGKLFLFAELGLMVLLVLFLAIFAFLPLLLFLRLRGLARRVRSRAPGRTLHHRWCWSVRLNALYRCGNRGCEQRGEMGLRNKLDVAIAGVADHDAGDERRQRTFHPVESLSACAFCDRVLDGRGEAATQVDPG